MYIVHKIYTLNITGHNDACGRSFVRNCSSFQTHVTSTVDVQIKKNNRIINTDHSICGFNGRLLTRSKVSRSFQIDKENRFFLHGPGGMSSRRVKVGNRVKRAE